MKTRHILIGGTFLLSMLLYVDRVCISAAKEAISTDLSLTDVQMGWVFSAFSLSYALCQTPSGRLADRFGPRAVLPAVVACWSIFTAVTAAARGLFSLLLVRFLFGAGQAGAYPGTARAFYSWLPMSERGLAQGINFSAARIGAALTLPGIALMVRQVGWRTSFVLLGAIGFVWSVAWYAWFRNDPTEHSGIAPDELGHILRTRQAAFVKEGTSSERLSMNDMLRSKNMWLVMGQYFASNFTFYFCLTWMLPHLSKRYGLSPTDAGWYATIPLLAGILGNWVGGATVDALHRRGRFAWSRRLPAMIGFALAGVGMLAGSFMDDIRGEVLCLSLAVIGSDMSISPSWSVCIDIGRRDSGAVSGTMNMAGNLGSFVTALCFPYFAAWSGSTAPFFVVGALLDFAAVGLWFLIRSDRPLEARR